MAAKHMKLLLAALALLLALAATFAYASESGEGEGEGEGNGNGNGNGSGEGEGEGEGEGNGNTTPKPGNTNPPNGDGSDEQDLSGACNVSNCVDCNKTDSSVCLECEDKYDLSEDGKECKEGVFAPARAASAVLVFCVLAATALAL